MLKGAKKDLKEWEEKVLIMPSTLTGSSFINSQGKLILFAIVIAFICGLAVYSLFIGAWLMAFYYAAAYLIISRGITFLIRTSKRRKGYVQVDRKTALELIDIEKLYARLSVDDRATYKGYFEAAFYGEATPKKVAQLFDQKISETPRALDDLIDLELPPKD